MPRSAGRLGAHRRGGSGAPEERAVCGPYAVSAGCALSVWRWPWSPLPARDAGRAAGAAARAAGPAVSPAPRCAAERLPVLLGAASAGISLFAAGYFRSGEGTPPGLLCLQYHVFLASMGFVLLADDAYAFMVAWEIDGAVLVLSRHHAAPDPGDPPRRVPVPADRARRGDRDPAVLRRAAGRKLAVHVRRDAGRDVGAGRWATVAFLLALFGFGAKAGLVPLHVWLPEAHPAAPSPVSALMSGVMLKTAVYGVLRVTFDLLGGSRTGGGASSRSRVGLVQRVLRRGVRRGADGHEAAARVLLDREHRHRRSRASDSRSSSTASGMRTLAALATDRAPLSLPQPRVHEEPAVPRHRRGAALDRRTQPRASSAD